MRDFILLKTAGLIALPKGISKIYYDKLLVSGWMVRNTYFGGW